MIHQIWFYVAIFRNKNQSQSFAHSPHNIAYVYLPEVFVVVFVVVVVVAEYSIHEVAVPTGISQFEVSTIQTKLW